MRSLVSRMPRHMVLAIFLITIWMVFLFWGRLAFWLYFEDPHDPLAAGPVLKSFFYGFKFDLRLSLIMALPLLILGGRRIFHPMDSRRASIFWRFYGTIITLGLITFYALDFGYYAYLQVRMDASSLRFLENPVISAQMVSETYPVGIILLGFVVACLCVYMGYGGIVRKLTALSPNRVKLSKRLSLVVWILIIGALYGKFSRYPLRWSDAFWSSHAFSSSLSSNPVLYFFSTIKNRNLVYDRDAVSHYLQGQMGDFLGLGVESVEELNFQRQREGQVREKSVNVVLVILESFAQYKTGLSGNPLNPTPNFDELASNGALFNHFYTPHLGTARGMWATLTGIPDVELQRTSSRNPLVINQHSIINEFRDHEKFYFLGGSASWANIRGMLAHNIPGLKFYEEGSYEAPAVDVWGISDLDLFRTANKVFAQQEKPFFAIVQTSGNHRPYTIPEDNDGFRIAEEEQEVLDKAGFINVDEYNAFRLMDHSLGAFMKMAREEDYFQNTLFVFLGDHGIVGYGGDHSPVHDSQLDLTRVRVPLLFYGPEIVQPGVYEKIGSQVDVLPSLAYLAGINYTNTTLGRNLFDASYDDNRFAFTIVHGKREMGVLNDQFYLKMNLDGANKKLYQLGTSNPRENVADKHPQITSEMIELCRGMFETANYLRYHNGHLND